MTFQWKMMLLMVVTLLMSGRETVAAKFDMRNWTDIEINTLKQQDSDLDDSINRNQYSEGTTQEYYSFPTYYNGSPIESCPPLEVLDFLQFNSENEMEVQELEETWPCEVRIYWLKMQGLVSTVRFLFAYIAIILVIFGLVVNTASLCVLNSPPMNTSSISVYLRALAVSDIGALLFNVTIGFLRAHSQKVNDFYVTNNIMCHIHKLLSCVFFYYSTWLVVALTFERLVFIKYPFKDYQCFKFRPSSCVVAVLGCVCLALGLIRTQITGYEQDNMYGYTACGSKLKPRWNYYIIPFVAMTTLVPTTLIFIGNICLLLHIRRSAQDHSDLHASKPDEGLSTLKTTRILLVISVTYLVLLLPAGLVATIELHWKTSYHKRLIADKSNRESFIKLQEQMLLIKWIRGFLFFFFLLNYNINFFLYCISGRKFRETVKICLQRWLPAFCQCACIKQRNKFSISSSQKHQVLVTSLSALTLQSDRRTSNSSETSEQGCKNPAFVSNESNVCVNKQHADLKLAL